MFVLKEGLRLKGRVLPQTSFVTSVRAAEGSVAIGSAVAAGRDCRRWYVPRSAALLCDLPHLAQQPRQLLAQLEVIPLVGEVKLLPGLNEFLELAIGHHQAVAVDDDTRDLRRPPDIDLFLVIAESGSVDRALDFPNRAG